MTSTRTAPTPKQMQILASLAASRGQSFTYPKTRREASAQIKRLLAAKPASRYELARERAVAKQLPVTMTDAAAVTEAEVTGYGSSARWSTIADNEAPSAGTAAASHFDPAARRARIAKANAESNRHLKHR